METASQDDGESLIEAIKAELPTVLQQKAGRTKQRFQRLGQVYSKAHGSYVAWKTDVNLDSPKALGRRTPADANHAREYYTALQYTLFETGFPETVDRTEDPRTHTTPEEVSVTVLSSPVECIGLLIEGGKRCPDGFILILSASWVQKVPCSDSTYNLMIYKGITFGRGGATYLDEYDPPRKCTYLLNFFTANITGGQRNDGTELEKNLECPMSASIEMAAKVDNKVWTTAIMAEVGMGFPEFLGFCYRPSRKVTSNHEKIRIVDIDDKEKGYEVIAEEVQLFLNQPFMQNIPKIVVKPSGPMFYGSIGVTIHKRENQEDIILAAAALLRDLEPACSILVEAFIPPLKARETGKTKTEFHSQMYGFRCRVNLSRDIANRPRTCLVTCGVNMKDSPINGDNTVHQSLETTLKLFGIIDRNEQKALMKEIYQKSEAVMQYIIEDDKKEFVSKKFRGETDLIGIDVVITDGPDGKLTFAGIEVNSHDSIINCHVQEFVTSMVGLNPVCFTTVCKTMTVKSQRYIMEGKLVLLIGAGGYSKRQIYREALKEGMQIVMVDSNEDCEYANQVYKFIYYDFTNHNHDQGHARNIVNLLRCEDIEIDGCLTFWEDCVPLTSAIVELLDTNGNCFDAAVNAKQKSRTQMILQRRGDDIPHWPRTCHYASKVFPITCGDDLVDIDSRMNFPCILKLEYGSSAVGVYLCDTADDVASQYKDFTETLSKEEDFPGIGLGFNNSMLVMEYWTGTEHDIDIVIYNRKFVTAIVTDNGPTRVPLFAETAACMPSNLPKDKQAQMIAAAYQCCTEIGLENGVFNVELKMTAVGPKLIEINARMGGFYIREWVKLLYGIDLSLSAMMIACDIKPVLFKEDLDETIMGIMLVPSAHNHILQDNKKVEELRKMHQNKEIVFTEFAEHLEEAGEAYEEPVANVAVRAETVEECKERLMDICHKFRIQTEEYDVAKYIQDF